jgi:undecaprenyl-diphosphatase
MNLIESILLGLIQGITEFIPVSSSGHLTLFGRVFDIDSGLMLSFTTLLHVGTLLSVFIVMRKEIMEIFHDIFGKITWMLVVATIPAVIAALLLGDFLDKMFEGNTLGYQFMFTGLILLSTLMIKQDKKQLSEQTDRNLEDMRTHTVNEAIKAITYKQALIAGIGQAVAILPGISRSGSTLASLLFCKIKRKTAVKFAFLMSIPAIAGGFLLDLIKMIKGEGSAITEINTFVLIAGIAAAFLSGWLAMNFMLKKLTAKGMLIFAVYVMILGTLVLIDQNWLHLVF